MTTTTNTITRTAAGDFLVTYRHHHFDAVERKLYAPTAAAAAKAFVEAVQEDTRKLYGARSRQYIWPNYPRITAIIDGEETRLRVTSGRGGPVWIREDWTYEAGRIPEVGDEIE